MAAYLNQYSNGQDVVVYRTEDGTVQLNVHLSDETVWLTRQQMAMLFDVKENNITYHIKEIYKTAELQPDSTTQKNRVVRREGNLTVARQIDFYNLDMIISVGYRVNSAHATQFRQWATKVLKKYLLDGYAINPQLAYIERRIDERFYTHEKRIEAVEEKIDFFVRTALPPAEKSVLWW